MSKNLGAFATLTTVVTLGCLTLLSIGCEQSGDAFINAGIDQDSELTQIEGQVVIDGSSTVAPISEAAAEAFERVFKNVKVTVATSGTGGGFSRFYNDETDISDASRPIKSDEFESCKRNNVGFVELPIAYDGLTIVVNKENNFVTQLTIEDLKKIFLQEGGAKNWNDVHTNWPETEIKIYAPGTDSGTFDYFFGDVVAKDEDNEHPRDDMSVSEDDNVLVTGVAGETGAIGFFGASYYFANRDKIKAVPIVDPNTGTAHAPTPASIESGDYAPFSRPLFIYVKQDSLRRPEVKQFVEFYLMNAPSLAQQVDYVALPPELYELATRHYEDRMIGTHYLTREMNKRSGSLVEIYTPDNLLGIE